MNYLALVGVAVVAVIFFALSMKYPRLRKYRKYIIILALAGAKILFKILMAKKKIKKDGKAEAKLVTAITDIKQELQEANMTAKVEVAVAKKENSKVIVKLAEIKKEVNQAKRLDALAEMMGDL